MPNPLDFTITDPDAMRYELMRDATMKDGGQVQHQDMQRVHMADGGMFTRLIHGSPTKIKPEVGRFIDTTTEQAYALKRAADKMDVYGQQGPGYLNQFDVPSEKLIRFDTQFTPDQITQMRKTWSKIPADTTSLMGEDLYDLATQHGVGHDTLMPHIAKSIDYAGYQRLPTGTGGKDEWFRITNPDYLQRVRNEAHGGAVHMADGGQAEMPYGGVSLDNLPERNAFSLNSKPASQAYSGYDVPQIDASGKPMALPKTSYDMKLDMINNDLAKGIKPDWMSFEDFAQDQVSRGRGTGHILPAAMKAMSFPYEMAEKAIGSSMGIDPTMGMIGKTGELHVVPGAGRFAAQQYGLPLAEKALSMYEQGQLTPGVNPALGVVKNKTAPGLVEHFHGSDTKGLTELSPEASQGRRSEGSSVWFKNNPAEASEYVKKNNGVVYTAPLDTSNFAVVDANFTSNKAIHPDAVIYHSNGETTPVSMLGEKVTTDAIAAHSRAKGDPGVRILNVGDKGSGRVRSEEPYGESVAVHSPVKPTAERTLKEIEQPRSQTIKVNEREIPVTMNPVDERSGYKIVNVKTQPFEEAFKQTDQYIGPRGTGNTISDRYKKVGEFLKDAPSMQVGNVHVRENGTVIFGDGRHRYAYLRDSGLNKIPIAMDDEAIANAEANGYLAKRKGGQITFANDLDAMRHELTRNK